MNKSVTFTYSLAALGVASFLGLSASSALAHDGKEGHKHYTASAKAHQIAQQNLIIDTHIDVPYRLKKGLGRCHQGHDSR